MISYGESADAMAGRSTRYRKLRVPSGLSTLAGSGGSGFQIASIAGLARCGLQALPRYGAFATQTSYSRCGWDARVGMIVGQGHQQRFAFSQRRRHWIAPARRVERLARGAATLTGTTGSYHTAYSRSGALQSAGRVQVVDGRRVHLAAGN